MLICVDLGTMDMILSKEICIQSNGCAMELIKVAELFTCIIISSMFFPKGITVLG